MTLNLGAGGAPPAFIFMSFSTGSFGGGFSPYVTVPVDEAFGAASGFLVSKDFPIFFSAIAATCL